MTTDKRAWLYGLAWLASGVVFLALSVWLVTLVRWGWASDRAEQQLSILGNALFISLALSGMVTFGLTMRNAIRNLKGTAGGVTVEAESQDGEGA